MTRRNRPIEVTDHPEHRSIPIDRIELRDSDDENVIHFSGYASTFEPYSMYGGPAQGGWIEQIARGAFDKTLREKPDLMFLINHEGTPLARTRSGTCRLSVDDHGLRVDADLDRRDDDSRNLEIKMKRGDLDEMSFAFRVKAQEWAATGDFPDDDMALRTITEVSLHKGDVSVVNYGANPTTSASVRSIEEALRVIAECDDKDLVEARSDEDLAKRAQERLGTKTVIQNLTVMSPNEVRQLESSEDDIRAWLDVERVFVQSWLNAEEAFMIRSWLDAENAYAEAVAAWLEAEREHPKKGMSLRMFYAKYDD